MTAGVWVDEWQLPYETFALTFAAKRARRRPSRSDLGSEEYLVSVADTSAAARRRVSLYDPPCPNCNGHGGHWFWCSLVGLPGRV